MVKPNVFMSSCDFDVKGHFRKIRCFLAKLNCFTYAGLLKTGVKPTKIPKCGFYDKERLENALGGSNMGSTEPLAGDIALELLDNKLLLIDDRFYEISNGDYAAYLACFHDR